MAHISVTVDTPTKTYQGKLNLASNTSLEEANTTVKSIAAGINTLEFLSIEANGAAIVFGKDMISKSVITLVASES